MVRFSQLRMRHSCHSNEFHLCTLKKMYVVKKSICIYIYIFFIYIKEIEWVCRTIKSSKTINSYFHSENRRPQVPLWLVNKCQNFWLRSFVFPLLRLILSTYKYCQNCVTKHLSYTKCSLSMKFAHKLTSKTLLAKFCTYKQAY